MKSPRQPMCSHVIFEGDDQDLISRDILKSVFYEKILAKILHKQRNPPSHDRQTKCKTLWGIREIMKDILI